MDRRCLSNGPANDNRMIKLFSPLNIEKKDTIGWRFKKVFGTPFNDNEVESVGMLDYN